MFSNYSLFKYQFGSGELEMGECPLKRKNALERVMIEDYLRENRLVFTNIKRNIDYMREYMWIPTPDGEVTVFKFGYERKCNANKSRWSTRKLVDFPHCVIVLSLKESSPYILVWGFEESFKSADKVIGVLGDALNTRFYGRGISISITPCDHHDIDAEDWGHDMLKVYQKTRKHKEVISTLLHNSANKKRQISSDFKTCVEDPEKADAVIDMMHKYMKGKRDPKDIFMVVAAAEKAQVIREPSWPEVSSEFHLEASLKSSYYRLMRVGCKSYDSPAFGKVVEKFKAL